MNKLVFLTLSLWVRFLSPLSAQTLYVDAVKGKDGAPGTKSAPIASLGQAVERASKFKGDEPITIKIAPGLYSTTNPLIILPGTDRMAHATYTFEALTMPDDKEWIPAKMPVIQCSADSNRAGRLTHASSSFRIRRNNVVIKGLKFVGNPNPASAYYYAIERQDSTLTGLDISQCYFLGDKKSAPMQGGLFAQGSNIVVNHCIFYNTKNAVMVFTGLNGFSLTNSIVYGAYEGAVWYGYGKSSTMPFTFRDNIIANGKYVWVGCPGSHQNYVFSHSLITGNAFYMGFNEGEIVPDKLNKPEEIALRKTGKVIFDQEKGAGRSTDYYKLSSTSAGSDIDAGIFHRK